MGFYKISFLILGKQKWTQMAFLMLPSHIIARSSEPHTQNNAFHEYDESIFCSLEYVIIIL